MLPWVLVLGILDKSCFLFLLSKPLIDLYQMPPQLPFFQTKKSYCIQLFIIEKQWYILAFCHSPTASSPRILRFQVRRQDSNINVSWRPWNDLYSSIMKFSVIVTLAQAT